jgi:hypothetical protein
MSQKNTTRGIEIDQGSNQQPQIKVVTTNVEIPIGYLVNPVVGSEVRPTTKSGTASGGTDHNRVTKSGAKKSGTTPLRATKNGITTIRAT